MRTLALAAALGALCMPGCSSDDAPLGPASGSGATGADASSPDGGGGGSSGGAADGGGGGPDAAAGSLAPGRSTRTLQVAGKPRSVLVVAPLEVSTRKLPLVLALHGNGDTNGNFVTVTTKLEALAAEEGFVLAAPQGVRQTITIGQQTISVDWDAYRSEAAGNIDLPLLDALRDELVATGSIDERRVLVLGYSQGGYLSFRYGMDRSPALACAAVLAAANPLGPSLTAQAARKVAVALQIGTNDGAIGAARQTKADLEQKGFPLDYREIQGAGHVPVPGDLGVPLGYCLGQALP